MSIIDDIKEGIKNGNTQLVKDKTELALHQDIEPEIIINEGLIKPMEVVGKRFKSGEIFIPAVLMSSRAMHAGLYILKPIIQKNNIVLNKGTIIIGTVAGDLHDIGKNMVAMFLSSQGYNVINLGIDVPSSDFIKAVKKYKPDILALSALLTTTMSEQNIVIQAIKEAGLKSQVKVIVGGGPVTYEFARVIGADGYAKDLFEAVDLVDKIMKQAG